MPGKEGTLSELPENVKKVLPSHAQEIYLKAHDNAMEEYKDPSKRRGDESLEEVAHKVAWAAVERMYEKNEKGEPTGMVELPVEWIRDDAVYFNMNRFQALRHACVSLLLAHGVSPRVVIEAL